MGSVFDETLSRLRGGSPDETWWRPIFDRLGKAYASPDFLQKPAIQEWLKNIDVQNDLKIVARNTLQLGTQNTGEARGRLQVSYATYTGEEPRLADGVIGVLIDILVGGFQSGLDRRDFAGIALLQADIHGVQQQVQTLARTFGSSQPDLATVRLISRSALDALALIIKRRILDAKRAREDIQALEQRFGDENDLRLADRSVQVQVLTWAARLYAINGKNVQTAVEYRDRLRALEPNADTRIVDALILHGQGDHDAALRMARDVDTADGHAIVFILLHEIQGQDAALRWFREQDGRDSVRFFTDGGWYNFIVALASNSGWTEAVDRVRVLHDAFRDSAALAFLHGMMNAAMLVAEPVRLDFLEAGPYMIMAPTTEDPEAGAYRTAALDALSSAGRMLDELDLCRRADQARLSCYWLRLTDPRPEVSRTARMEIAEAMTDGVRAVPLLPLARVCDIEFDPTPVRRYLEVRKRLGGLSTEETVAEFMLAAVTLGPRDRAEYIAREYGRLETVFARSYLVGEYILALARDEQGARAGSVLEERRGELSPLEYERLRTLVDLSRGMDVRAQAEALYQQSESLIDLHNLTNITRREQDWVALLPLQERLFQLERTRENAELVIDCMQRSRRSSNEAMLSFLEANSDLVERSSHLASAKAWALFHLGRWKEADAINQDLLRERSAEIDLGLDTNLAIQTGDWERFAVIVEREWPRRTSYGPATLMRLASLAAEADSTSDRAMQLAALAATQGANDPNILVSAVTLAFQLGREADADQGWMARAIELSTDEGPLQRVDMQRVVEEIAPAHRERSQAAEQGLVRGEIPLHFGATALNVPLSNILLALPRRNMAEQDGRRRAIIPIISGARAPVQIRTDWIVGLDITSILVLAHVEMLSVAIDAFRAIVLSPETMVLLLNERRRVRFHQPSRVRKAEEIRTLVDRGQLRSAEQLSSAPASLLEEVGDDLAELLATAESKGGIVVHPRPIQRVRDFQTTEADLGAHSHLVLSAATVVRLLYESGKMDASTYQRTRRYLAVHDVDDETTSDISVLRGPLYLDDLAVIYLQEAGVLEEICACGLDLIVHPTMRAQQERLIDFNREGEQTARFLSSVRLTLKAALEAGKATFLPHSKAVHPELATLPEALTLTAFLDDSSPCDAVCIDDRFVNRNAVLTDRSQRMTPVVCVTDVLQFLRDQSSIAPEQAWDATHRLRHGSFGLIPVAPDELEGRLRQATLSADGVIIETAELRAIRQVLMRIRSLDMLQQPAETRFLDRLRASCILTILRLVRDEGVSVARVTALSSWIWQYVAPSPIDWIRTSRDRAGLLPVTDAFAVHVCSLLQILIGHQNERQRAFREWLEQSVLVALRTANTKLLDSCAEALKAQIERLVDEFERSE